MISTVQLTTIGAFVGGGIAMGFGAIGPGVGEGYTAREAVTGMARQPQTRGELLRTMLIGQAISESPGIFSLVIALALLTGQHVASLAGAMALLGAGLAVGLSAIGAGTGAGMASAEACASIARQPECRSKVTVTMLIGQALSTSPAIFGFVIALLLSMRTFQSGSLVVAAALLGSGLCMGAGAIGPGLGIGLVGMGACTAVGRNANAAGAVNKVLLLGAAVSESTSIYAFIIAVILQFFISG